MADIRLLATGIRISLLAFGVAAFFHPIAYQFYFFTIAGLAVALRGICRGALAPAAADRRDRQYPSAFGGVERLANTGGVV